MTKAKVPERWKNAIVGYDEVDPSSLLAHPENPKIHPKAQQDALAGVLSEVGWIAPVLVNTTTQHVLDGHARIGLAISRGEPTVPVAYVTLSEESEWLALATFDPVGALAVMDNESLAALLDGLTSADEAVANLLRDLAVSHPPVGTADPGPSLSDRFLVPPFAAPERFEQDARECPPFPSCSNYDAKAWRFIRRYATPGALFWNVAA